MNWDIATRGDNAPFAYFHWIGMLPYYRKHRLQPSPPPPFPPNIVRFSHMTAQGNKPRGYFIPCPYVFRSSLAKGKRKVCWLSNTTQCTRLTLEPGFLDQASIELTCVADRALVCLQRKLPSNWLAKEPTDRDILQSQVWTRYLKMSTCIWRGCTWTTQLHTGFHKRH